MKIPMMRWVVAVLAGILTGFAILGAEATFQREFPHSRGHVFFALGFSLAMSLVATVVAARFIRPSDPSESQRVER